MPSPRSLLDDLPFCLARATLGFRRFSDHTLRAVAVPSQAPGMATLLHALDEMGECTVAVLVEKTHLPNGTLTGLLDALVREGFIRRLPNPLDGRSWIIQLTTDGEALCQKLAQRHRTVMRVFGEALSEKEAAELTRLLGKLTDQMRRHTTQGEDRPKATRRNASAPKSTKKKRSSR